jgi:dienelactone hydrolase
MPPLIGLALAACAHQTGQERIAAIQAQTVAQGWQSQVIRTPQFDLQAFTNNQPAVNGVLNVYIEGDGYAWVDGQFPSDDPTPHKPLGLQLAMAQPEGAVAYLGRPCQYIGAETDARCHKKVWTDARFSQAVVAATNTAIDQLKAQQKAGQVRLVGYSGGAAVTLLVAAQRNDIKQIITVAGNLDPHTWAKQLKLQPLNGSLDTATIIQRTSKISQVDFVGGKDKVVPAALTVTFAQSYPTNQQPRIINEPGFGHVCCWAEHWPQLWTQATTQ